MLRILCTNYEIYTECTKYWFWIFVGLFEENVFITQIVYTTPI